MLDDRDVTTIMENQMEKDTESERKPGLRGTLTCIYTYVSLYVYIYMYLCICACVYKCIGTGMAKRPYQAYLMYPSITLSNPFFPN